MRSSSCSGDPNRTEPNRAEPNRAAEHRHRDRDMGTQGAGRKRTTNKDKTTAEDDALNLIAREAEARLAAKRAARAEAREIRMKELEQQQKEIFQVQKKYYGLNPREQRADSKWGDIEQWMEDSERFSRSSLLLHTLSDDDERMSVGSRGSVRSDLDSVGAYGGGGSSLHRKSKKKKKHKHRDRNGCHDDHIALSSRSSFTSCDLLDLSGPSRNPGLSFNRYQNLLYDDGLSLCSGSRRVSSCHPVEFSSYRSSRASSRASSARTSPVVEDRDFDKGPRAASVVTATTLTSVGGTSSRRGSAETPLTVDADGSVRDIKEIHELKDQIQDVEAKYQQNLKEAKEALAEVEEKYRKAMVSNAQLDNEKNNLMYQVDTLKDSLMELEELLSESRRQYDDKLKEFERQKHANGVLQFQFDELKETLKQSEELLNEIRQLRLKQEGFIREISDLQETVEWKDKKIRALERQKDYSDAIRLERDELREEAVRLRDVLKKHGIVLGPDLNVNGDAGPAEAAGAERPAQAAPAEGNGVLGSTEELRACRDQDETLEDVKLNHWSCDGQTPEAPTSEDPDGQIPADPIDRPDPKAKAVIAVGQDLQQIQTSGDTETCEVDSPSHPGLTATDAPGGDLSGGQESKQEVVTTEPVAKQAGLNSEHQQEPEEAENDEETASKSQAQVSTASGKKKKRKKKTKKRGGTHENKEQQEAGTEKQNEKTRTDSVVQDNRLTAEQETSESTAGPQHNQEPEKAKDLEPPENVSTKEKLQEPNTDPGSEGHDQEKHTNTRMSEGADVLGSTQAARLGVEIVNDPQNEEDPEKPDEGSAGEILKESEITGPDQEGNLVTCKSNEDSDSREDIATREATREATGEATDQVSGDEGKTGNTEMLEQSDAVGSSGHIGATAELPEDQQNQETSPTAKETAEPPEGLEESGPEAKMAEGGARETNLPSNKGAEGPNQHLPPCDDSAATPGVQEPDSDHVSGDQEEESPETPDEELVEVLQDQEETSEPEKHESVLQTTEASQTETIKVLINVSETAEDVEETESETGSDGGSNLLTSGKSEDPEEAIPPHRSSPEDVSVVQNVLTKSGSMERDEKMINNPESLVDGVPESRTGPEINEETSASSANDEAGDQPETWPTSKEAAEPKVRTSEELCRDDDGAEPEGPPLHLEGEVESADPTQAETGDTGSPPKASAGCPEPEDGPNTGEVKELMEEPEGVDSPPHLQLDDGEEDEGQSFDFDDSDVEAAVESALSSKLDLEDVEKGAEVNGDSSQRCQSNAETKTDDGEETVSQDDDGDVDQPSTANDLPSGDDTPEQVENVPENTKQKTSPTAEDGLDATQVPSGPHKTPEQTHGAKEEPQGRDPKKKKGKGKSKEDCKMS